MTRRQPTQDAGATMLASESVYIQLNTEAPPETRRWQLPIETPVALRVNGEDYAVMLCTPQDLQDFARGFMLSEALLPTASAIQSLQIKSLELGIRIEIQAKSSALARQALKQRSLAGRSGCGLCGTQSLEEVMRPLPPLAQAATPSAEAVARAFDALPDHQPINRDNRSVHVAAWCDLNGTIRLAREDVGRHNALDKLIGALALTELAPQAGFAVLSSRCSYELVQKAVTFGIPTLATLSAPTSLAVTLAEQAGLQLFARCDPGIAIFGKQSR